ERSGAVLIQPLIGEYRARFRTLGDSPIDVCALVEQVRDVGEAVHVGGAHRVVAAFDIAVVDRQIQWRPAPLVGQIHVGTVLDKELRYLIVLVLRGGQQGTPAVASRLVHIGTADQLRARGIDATCTG